MKYQMKKKTFLVSDEESSEHAVAIVRRSEDLLEFDQDLDISFYLHAYLRISSSNGTASFHFALDTPGERAESLESIRTLADIVVEFREALEKEAEEIETREALANEEVALVH